VQYLIIPEEEIMKASPVNRLLSALIDGVILYVVILVLQMLLRDIGTYVGIIVDFAYFAYFWITSGQTIGKKVMGLKVVPVGGGKMDIVKALLRYVGYFVSSIFLIGFIWILFDKNGQGFHDKIAGTKVVSAK
jgi:uncharacterized RDD family membrane protein YckC